MKVVILGHGDMLANLIAGALDAKVDVVGVLRYDRVRNSAFKMFFADLLNPTKECSYIKSYKIHEIRAKSANSEAFRREIIKLNADIIIVGTWGEKLTMETIRTPKIASINVHPSLLPKYRGSNPYLQTIWHKEKQSGVTFHLMDENFDTGAILIQKVVDILPSDTGKELRDRTVLAARGAVCELFETMKNKVILPVPQIEAKSSYFNQVKADEVMLDFSQPAEDVCAHIRAFHPWLRCYFAYRHRFLIPSPYDLEIVTNCDKLNSYSLKDASVTVKCGDGKFLKMSKLKFY